MTQRIARRIAAACALAALSAPSFSAAVWDFSVCNGYTVAPGTAAGSQSGAGAVGNTYACAANGSTTRDLTVSAWGAVSSTNNTFGTAFVSNQGIDGFGVGSQSEGGAAAVGSNTSLDNDPTTLAPNLILLAFSSAVVLDKVTLGWSMNDADLTIMAYTGALAPPSFVAGMTAATLTAGGAGAGWSLVQNVGDIFPDFAYASSGTNIVYGVNSGGISSAFWLVSAYDTDFGGGAMDSLVDYVELLAIGTREAAQGVPEPGTLALLGLGLAGVAATRRRRS